MGQGQCPGPHQFHSLLTWDTEAASPTPKQNGAQQPQDTWTTGDGIWQGTRLPKGPSWGLPVGILLGSPRMLKVPVSVTAEP